MNERYDRERSQAPSGRRLTTRQKTKVGVAALVLVLVLIFVFQNLQAVDMDYFGWALRLPLAILFIVALLIGMLIGWALTRFGRWRPRR